MAMMLGKRRTKILSILVVVLMFFLLACESGSDNIQEGTGDEIEADSDEGVVEDELDVGGDEAEEEVVYNLGETGVMSSPHGEYELTVKSFEFFPEYEGVTPMSGILLAVDVSFHNIGEEPIDAASITRSNLFTEDETRRENMTAHEFTNEFSGDIEVGETVEGRLWFDHRDSDHYELVFGYGVSHLSTVISWEFSADEAK